MHNESCTENLAFPIIGKELPFTELDIFHENEIKKIHLNDYLGQWVILFFYPADFTFICPTELKELAENYKEFQNLNTEIISVSTDTVFTHKAWHDTSPIINKIKFPMAADPSAKLSKQLGAYVNFDGFNLRVTVLVDPEGIIRVYEMNDSSIGRNVKELLRKLRAAQFVRENGGEVCPASWEPGMASLKPSLALVGKI
ncbi:MAG: 2-cysteine peroxiredoxin [Candidatus Peregrinibacteria bacterium GW2011_GWA2_33_10]|nr:MAG: 2-cysteine peroxiredoxin [Candidatus Peregrinibacteria bacterium GW2011_GWA2_33_10]KKP40941.1 MAG: alkyl hydroperoxide reductase, peroxiredoxin (alkyl hydroperoxide reductase subunit C) [Candidatus Peregrinibacteria bacterium GW2011_GWC2_33_13]OGJ49581.1 MAG: peroxiredoxin [Candidatus Peregrinibacteria bacterium RIFOXYA2_FULL_33_7]